MIATFEEQPYRGRFSGNVIELCPVGALTSTEYRFKARPWEINNIPSVCALCPTGCNTWTTVREGDVRRVLSRNHPEVDEGWLCDKGRFAHAHLHAGDRYLQGLVRGPRGLEPASAEQLAETIARRLRHHATLHGPESIAVVASGEQSNEEAHAWAELVRAAGGGALVAAATPAASTGTRSRPTRRRIAELDDADLIVVAGERELGDAAGVLELRVRQAVRGGARLLLAGQRRRRPRPHRRRAHRAGRVADALRDAEHPVLIATEPAAVAAAAATAHSRRAGRRAGRRDRRPGRAPTSAACTPSATATSPAERAAPRRGRHAADARRAGRRRSALALPRAGALGGRAAALRVGRRELALPDADGALGARHPARDLDAREGRHDHESRGPHAAHARRRAAARTASRTELALLAAAGRHLGLELAASPLAAFARRGRGRAAVRRADLEAIGLHAPLTS